MANKKDVLFVDQPRPSKRGNKAVDNATNASGAIESSKVNVVKDDNSKGYGIVMSGNKLQQSDWPKTMTKA